MSSNRRVFLMAVAAGTSALAATQNLALAADTVLQDIDPQAVESARQNSVRNHADVTYALPDDCPPGEFDIVVANILSNPLKLMASMLSSRVKPGGRLALSGILARQAEEVAKVYERWIDIAVWGEHEGWVCLAGTRRDTTRG